MCEESGEFYYSDMLFPGVRFPGVEFDDMLHADQVRRGGSFIHFYVDTEFVDTNARYQIGTFISEPNEISGTVSVLFADGTATRLSPAQLGIVGRDTDAKPRDVATGFSVDPFKVPHIMSILKNRERLSTI